MILDLLKFVLSGPFKFIGFLFILLIVATLIEGIVGNICRTIITTRKIKYDKEIQTEQEIKTRIGSSLKSKNPEPPKTGTGII